MENNLYFKSSRVCLFVGNLPENQVTNLTATNTVVSRKYW